ncbi:MAG: hypothetical protein ATN31_09075 [Candidatus Epulonipiscioides saccharophilum]|nr:MAG: hypothetical protein ATN31_09075 [Epulopiscium sp. AS2M-Bin001]
MKKFGCITLILTGLFVGCAQESNTDEKVSISIQVDPLHKEYYESAIGRVLEENPNAEIEIYNLSSFDVYELISMTTVTNEDVPDVFAIGADTVDSFARNDVLAKVNALEMAEEVGGWSDFQSGLGASFKVGEDYLGFPFNIETLIVFANKANAEKNEVSITGPIEFSNLNYEDMLVPVCEPWFGLAFTNAVGLTLLDRNDQEILYSDLVKDYSDLTEQQQKMFASLFKYWQGHYAAATDLWDSAAYIGYIESEIRSGGDASFRIDGPWGATGMLEKTNAGKDLEVLALTDVTVNGDTLKHWQSGWGLVINARIEEDAEKMALAEELIKELVNPEYAADLFNQTGKILENVSVENYLESDIDETNKKIIVATINSYKQSVPRPRVLEWNQVWATWQNSILSWSTVQPKTVEDAYKQVQASFVAMMSNF